MKKLHLLLLLTMCAVCTISAQTVTTIDLTTGYIPGNCPIADPIWDVKSPGNSSFFDATHGWTPIGNFTNNCGGWISSHVGGNGAMTNAPIGTYYYQREFTYQDGGCSFQAILDIGALGVGEDDSLIGIRVNGASITYLASGPINHSTSHTLWSDITSHIVNGNNTVEFEVYNPGTSSLITALFICGEITITNDCEGCFFEAPQNLTCTSYYSLDWDDVNGALGYRIEILYNDMPRCCTWEDIENPWSPAPVYIDVLTGQSNYVLALPEEPCFSWRVAPLCYDQPSSPSSFGPWSDYACSCTETLWLKHGGSEKDEELGKASIYPNPTTGTFNINTSGYDHFYYKVTDISGRIIIDLTLSNGSSLDVDLSDQANGTYFITIEHGGTSEVIKLVKQD